MILEIEKGIIKAFFQKHKQDRLYYELDCGKDEEFIRRLSHDYLNYLKNECIILKSDKKRSADEIIDIMKAHDVSELCYVFSEYEEFNRKQMQLRKALEIHSGNGFAFLITGLPSGFSFFGAESYASYKPTFFLTPLNRFDKKWVVNGFDSTSRFQY
jgi:hypothetical protein